MARAKEQVFSQQEVEQRLEANLPNWFYDDGLICRKYKTSGWKSTLMVTNAIGHLAEAAWHHPDIKVSYKQVAVELMNHAAKGITDKDFELAEKIESMICWQPACEESALEGTPEDARYAYIKYDARKS